MADPTPPQDTDPLKRQGTDEISGVPDNDVGGGGRPGGDPRQGQGRTLGDRHAPATGSGSDAARQPRGDEPVKP